MQHRTVYLTRSGHHWIVRSEGSHPKIFATREAAVEAALLEVQSDGTQEPFELHLCSSDDIIEPVSFIVMPGGAQVH